MNHLTLTHDDLSTLTSRETEVLALMGWGLPRREIARKLYRSLHTIDRHRDSIMSKLNIHTSTQLALLSYRLRLHEEVVV